jgi:RNA 3'-terminal phosphate cyclase (ATP)
VTVDRTGFYPSGGGKATLRATPRELTPLKLERRGELDGVAIYSKASDDLESASVAERQAGHAADRLVEENLPVVEQSAEYVPTHSPGSVIVLAGQYDHTTLGVDTLGERGVPSESVADDAVDQFLRLHDAGAVVDAQMADQLMVVLALTGGTVRIPRVTPHVEANLSAIEKFDLPLSVSEDEGGYRLHAPPQSQR